MRVEHITKDNAQVLSASEPSARAQWLFALALAIAALVAYAGILHNDFVTLDDPVFVTANFNVKQGLSWNGVKWAFTELETDYWHPLAWLSHMCDVSLFGMWAGGHHLVSLLLHLLNTLLLFGFLRYTTRRFWPSIFVAALFALHPLHVESVAWVAERKDVLCTFFVLATMWMYASYVRRGGWTRYVGVIALYSAALMSKPMAVTLPFVLLLLDYWPLERLNVRQGFWKLIAEKLPLMAMAGVVMVLTIIGQMHVATVVPLDDISIFSRLQTAVVSYCTYICDMLWPHDLAALYPYSPVSLFAAVGAALVLAGLTAACFIWRRGRRYLVAGWLWYILTLLPVIGLVQVGPQSHADRYTYVPLIGLFVITAWLAEEWAQRRKDWRAPIGCACVIVLIVLGVSTARAAAYWKDALTLSTRAVSVTKGNFIMLRLLGQSQMPFDKNAAEANLLDSLSLGPARSAPLTCAVLAQLMYDKGSYDQAVAYCDKAIASRPDLKDAWLVKGLSAIATGRMDEAEVCLNKAIELDPYWGQAYAALAMLRGESGELNEGISLYTKGLTLEPELDDAWFNLAVLYTKKGDFRSAAAAYEQSARLKPTYETWLGLAGSLVAVGDLQRAQMAYRQAIASDTSRPDGHYGLAVALSGMGRRTEALHEAALAAKLAPENTAAQDLCRMLSQEQPQ
jgi:protein O-mannosyl-transferase